MNYTLLEALELFEDQMPPELAAAYKKTAVNIDNKPFDTEVPGVQTNGMLDVYDATQAKGLDPLRDFRKLMVDKQRRVSTWDYGAAHYEKITAEEAFTRLGFVKNADGTWALPRGSSNVMNSKLNNLRLIMPSGEVLQWETREVISAETGQPVKRAWAFMHPSQVLTPEERILHQFDKKLYDPQTGEPLIGINPTTGELHNVIDPETGLSVFVNPDNPHPGRGDWDLKTDPDTGTPLYQFDERTGQVIKCKGFSIHSKAPGDTKYANQAKSIANMILIAKSIYWTDEYQHPLDPTAIKHPRTSKRISNARTPLYKVEPDEQGKLTRSSLIDNEMPRFNKFGDPAEGAYVRLDGDNHEDITPTHGQRGSFLRGRLNKDLLDLSQQDDDLKAIDVTTEEGSQKLDQIVKSLSKGLRSINVHKIPFDTGSHDRQQFANSFADMNSVLYRIFRNLFIDNQSTTNFKSLDQIIDRAQANIEDQKHIFENGDITKEDYNEAVRNSKDLILGAKSLQKNLKSQLSKFVDMARNLYDEARAEYIGQDDISATSLIEQMKNFADQKAKLYSAVHYKEQQLKSAISSGRNPAEGSLKQVQDDLDKLVSSIEKVDDELAKKQSDFIEKYSKTIDKVDDLEHLRVQVQDYIDRPNSDTPDLQELFDRIDDSSEIVTKTIRYIRNLRSAYAAASDELERQFNTIKSIRDVIADDKSKVANLSSDNTAQEFTHGKRTTFNPRAYRSEREQARIAKSLEDQKAAQVASMKDQLTHQLEELNSKIADLEAQFDSAEKAEKPLLKRQIDQLKNQQKLYQGYLDDGEAGIIKYSKRIQKPITVKDFYNLSRYDQTPEPIQIDQETSVDDRTQKARDLFQSIE